MQTVPDTPLAGIRVIDFSALGPGPFASMMLADFGAGVLSIRRPGGLAVDPSLGMARGKDLIQLDLSNAEGCALAKSPTQTADVVLEGFSPGFMERLGVGPAELMAANPRLVYARLTGWGQTGPYAKRAGHDINYLAISDALGVCGPDRPAAPPALLGDLANGSYPAVIGIILALFKRARTGLGRIVDAAIVDGATNMLSAMFAERRMGFWSGDVRDHLLSGNAPFYGVYQCADDRWFVVGAIEAKFYDEFLNVLELHDAPRGFEDQMDRAALPAARARVAGCFLRETRNFWQKAFADHDACGTPVLALDELAADEHLAARGTMASFENAWCVAAAPRLSTGPCAAPAPTTPRARGLNAVLRAHGLTPQEIAAAIEADVAHTA